MFLQYRITKTSFAKVVGSDLRINIYGENQEPSYNCKPLSAITKGNVDIVESDKYYTCNKIQ